MPRRRSCTRHAPVSTMTARTGRFITLEGIDGAGKSTHVAVARRRASSARAHASSRRASPAARRSARALRALLLREPMTHDSEALLMFAARREHLERVIRPALARGDWVLCDRFTDATYAYQGGGHGVAARAHPRARAVDPRRLPARPHAPVRRADRRVARAARPRAGRGPRRSTSSSARRSAFFERVRDAYLERAPRDPQRFRVIDSTRPLDDVRADARAHLAALETAA